MRFSSFIRQVFLLFWFGAALFFHCVSAEEPVPDVSVMIPMRDGMELPTDLYLPNSEARHLPCILVRSPSGRRGRTPAQVAPMAQWGYVVAIQDTRSVLDAEGKTMPYLSDGWGEQQDGYDTVEWLGKSEWTNGRIGSVGASAQGITQLLMAPTAPPSLKCQYVRTAAASMYQHATYMGGRLLKSQVEGWLSHYAKDPSVLDCVLQQPSYNDFWQQLDTLTVADKVKTPAVHYGGWYDIFLQGSIEAFLARQNQGGDGAKNTQKLVIGPWTHFWPRDQSLGDFDVPEAGQTLPTDISEKRWLDYHLKGVDNGVAEVAPVIYYVMGPFDGSASSGNVWKTAETWPVPNTPTSLFLTADGQLHVERKPMQKGEVSFRYDPENPVPTVGGRNLFLDSGPKDQRSIEERDDVLLFTTDALNEDLEVTGKVTAKIFLSSNSDETDVAVRLCDVYPDGRSILVTDGLTRVSAMELDKQREVEVDLWSTSIVFAKGHRIRLTVTSSNYPCYEKNLSKGASSVATSVLVGKLTPSQVILPIVRGDNATLADAVGLPDGVAIEPGGCALMCVEEILH